MSDKETPLKEESKETIANTAAKTAGSDPAASPTGADDAAEQQLLKEAYERAREDLKVTADRLKREIDNIDTEALGQSTSNWIRENPGLSFLIAVSVGMVAGKAISTWVKSDPPPTMRQRVAQKTGHIANSARFAAGQAADRLSKEARLKREKVHEQLNALKGSVDNELLGQLLAEHAQQFGTVANEKTQHVLTHFTDAAERAADSLHVAAKDLSKSAKKYKKSNTNTVNSLTQAAKTILSAYVFKRLSDWFKK